MHIFYQLSFQDVLYSCILYVYNSNSDILPGVKCMLIHNVLLKERKNSPASDDFLAVRTLVCEDTDRERRCLIKHCGSLRCPRVDV